MYTLYIDHTGGVLVGHSRVSVVVVVVWYCCCCCVPVVCLLCACCACEVKSLSAINSLFVINVLLSKV